MDRVVNTAVMTLSRLSGERAGCGASLHRLLDDVGARTVDQLGERAASLRARGEALARYAYRLQA
ncbi:MAG: hypothetical protein ACRD0P_11645, partial [Stackebrandtia sp.]